LITWTLVHSKLSIKSISLNQFELNSPQHLGFCLAITLNHFCNGVIVGLHNLLGLSVNYKKVFLLSKILQRKLFYNFNFSYFWAVSLNGGVHSALRVRSAPIYRTNTTPYLGQKKLIGRFGQRFDLVHLTKSFGTDSANRLQGFGDKFFASFLPHFGRVLGIGVLAFFSSFQVFLVCHTSPIPKNLGAFI
jgi:hypothetical protein